jgi:hypothetical protein
MKPLECRYAQGAVEAGESQRRQSMVEPGKDEVVFGTYAEQLSLH